VALSACGGGSIEALSDPRSTEETRPLSERTIPTSTVPPTMATPMLPPAVTGGSSGSPFTPTTINDPWKPLPLKSIGFDLQPFDPATKSFGAMRFTKKVPFDVIFADFGAQDARSTDHSKRNPQPVFVLPVGTPVLATVDGVVVHVEKLYSGDWTIMVAENERSTYRYETEHVENVLVKVGDRVTGGQQIAEVSRYDEKNTPGFGLVEIGILRPQGSTITQHLCPFATVDPAYEEVLYPILTQLHAEWERHIGKDVYPEPTAVPGCQTTDPVNG